MAQYIAASKRSRDDFPAFKWCRDTGEGLVHLPAIDELLTTRPQLQRRHPRTEQPPGPQQVQRRAQRTPGGKRMDRLVYYFSSTEMDEKNAYTTHMGIEPPYVIEIPKYNKFLSCAPCTVLTLRAKTAKRRRSASDAPSFLMPAVGQMLSISVRSFGMIISQS
ncbi:MAG: hypothetical protein ACLU9X_11300 [Alistipes shahii]